MGVFHKLLGVFTNRFLVGRGRAENINIEAFIPGVAKPALRYNYAGGKWQYSNDGVQWFDVGSGNTGNSGAKYPQWFIPDWEQIRVEKYQQYLISTGRLVIEGTLSLASGSQLIVGTPAIASADPEFRKMLVEA